MIGADAEKVMNGVTRIDADNMVLLENEKFEIEENPGSRELTCFDEKMRRSIVSLHQLDYDLLLLQVEVNELCKHVVNNNATHQWILMTTKGKILKLPTLLEQILQKHEWKACSSSTNSELINLVLTYCPESEIVEQEDCYEGGESDDAQALEEAEQPLQADLLQEDN